MSMILSSLTKTARQGCFLGILFLSLAIATAGLVYADIPGRAPPGGPDGTGTSAPCPGAQQLELPNITVPSPYNVFDFPGACSICHGGTIDQQAAHGGNWAGSSMASAARDPVFRANQLIVNSTIKSRTGNDGAGSLCFRCHSPNGWLSGRFDPKLGGTADGRTMIQSIILSGDTEGVFCEACHRAIGSVTMKRQDLDPTDPAWNMMSGIYDWPHTGLPFPEGPQEGSPYGNGTLQFTGSLSYGAKYGGNMELFFSDAPFLGAYTGQTYGIYPWWYTGAVEPPPPGLPDTNPSGDLIAYNTDGSVSSQFEAQVRPDDIWGAVSVDHSTRVSDFILKPDFCGSCHDLTIPVLNHGMPEQRTFTEWRFSSFGRSDLPTGEPNPDYQRCQDCHMPLLKHEYADDAPVSLNPDPEAVGWYPYAKDRNISGGTSFHKFAGSNRDLPKMMKILYPEVDLEMVLAPTGHDTRAFPGMLSDRTPMWDRARRNSEISLRDAANITIISGPTLNPATAKYEVKVKVTNNSGHKLPSGYPDGRRVWISLTVKDEAGSLIYQSGHFDPASARLYNDSSMTGLKTAQSSVIDSADNAVMTYEKRTGSANKDPVTGLPTGTYAMSHSLINEEILFDNRIPPQGFSYSDYAANGARFWKYTGTESEAAPVEDPVRYAEGCNWDEVTYIFAAATPPVGALSARAELNYQVHSREFMDYLESAVNKLPAADRGPRPEGPPSIYAPNYPFTPTYLSKSIREATGKVFTTMTNLSGAPLIDNWGGIAYAAWLIGGKGAPYVMAADDTSVVSAPPAPAWLSISQPAIPETALSDPCAQLISWSPVPGSDGYIVWIRYGADPNTSDWDRLAVVPASSTQLLNAGLNVAKTYVYRVQAFNAKGVSGYSSEVKAQTPTDLPPAPTNSAVASVTARTATLTWLDTASNEKGFIIERQDVPLLQNQSLPPFKIAAQVAAQTPGVAQGTNTWTDKNVIPGRTYNYQISSYNTSGPSIPDLPITATTADTPPAAPTGLKAKAKIVKSIGSTAKLSWTDNAGDELGFVVERSIRSGSGFKKLVRLSSNSRAYTDALIKEGAVYYYRVYAYNNVGKSRLSNVAKLSPALSPPSDPGGLKAITITATSVTLKWLDSAPNEDGFEVYASEMAGTGKWGRWTLAGTAPANQGQATKPSTRFTVTKLKTGVQYRFRVRAVNGAGASRYTNVVSAVPQ